MDTDDREQKGERRQPVEQHGVEPRSSLMGGNQLVHGRDAADGLKRVQRRHLATDGREKLHRLARGTEGDVIDETHLALLERQRANHDRVDHAEDRGGRTDAE
jgi:hypothetical protein